MSACAPLAFIGFGEAGMAFAQGLDLGPSKAVAFDIKTLAARSRQAKFDDYHRYGVQPCLSSGEAFDQTTAALSLVTADAALTAATDAASWLRAGTWFFDMNSTAPATKRAAADVIGLAGGRFVDVAIMAPVRPLLNSTPLLVAGSEAEGAAAFLSDLGFANVRVVGAAVGAAATVKMIRSVMIKGLEALTAECALAAAAAGVLEEVIASLDSERPDGGWAPRIDYNLERMLVHGLRRQAELNEVVATLAELGTPSTMTRAAAEHQQRLGSSGARPIAGLEAKLRLILNGRANAA